jgi:hypothetical protein
VVLSGFTSDQTGARLPVLQLPIRSKTMKALVSSRIGVWKRCEVFLTGAQRIMLAAAGRWLDAL